MDGPLSGIVGCYERPKPTNSWHSVKITWDEIHGTFKWENHAGVTWSLALIPYGDGWNTNKLAVGPECPYFNNGHEFAGLVWSGHPGDSKLLSIIGPGNEAYLGKECPDLGSGR